MSKGRKALVSRARKSGLEVIDSKDFDSFHKLLVEVLHKHGAKPVHSIDELKYLNELYPSNIILKSVELNGEVVSAALLFVFDSVVHTQYLATNDLGRENGALDLIVEECISEYTSNKYKYFSFGISTEDAGKVLNQGLLAQKEGFGGRSIILDTYQVNYYG
nr:GNAT family N-acetyltransferase [Vibrio aestuarianus]